MKKAREISETGKDLQERLSEAEAILAAIQGGEVDALLIRGRKGEKIFTLEGAEHPYRIMVETMNEGAATFSLDGTVLYCNSRFAGMIDTPLNKITGNSIYNLIQPWDRKKFASMCSGRKTRKSRRGEFSLRAMDGSSIPVLLSLSFIRNDKAAESACIVATDIKDRKIAEEEIAAAHEKLRALTSELITTEERERQRIATALHDSVAQTLGVAKMKLEIIQDRADCSDLRGIAEIRGLIQQSIQQTRSIMSELSPQILYELGLCPAIEWLAEQMEKQHGLKVRFKGNGCLNPISGELETILFRATRELVMNVVRHARAKKAKVSVWLKNESINIEVEDDGIGFSRSALNNKQAQGGFGLFSIRERLNNFDGSLEINSRRGQGARIKISVPVQ